LEIVMPATAQEIYDVSGREFYADTLQHIMWAIDLIDDCDAKIVAQTSDDNDLKLITILSTFLRSLNIRVQDGVISEHPFYTETRAL
jgi:hypothetical protein